MVIEIPDELDDEAMRALEAIGLEAVGMSNGIVRTIISPGCMDCRTNYPASR